MKIIPETLPNLHHVKKSSIINILLFIILLMPEEFFSLGAIYSSSTPAMIAYKWLDYHYGVVPIIIVILGICMLFNEKKIIHLIVFLLVVLREGIIFLFGENSCFTNQAYEIYLTLITAFCMVNIVKKINFTILQRENFFWRSIFLNILTVYISWLFNLSSISDRYNASNLDVETTGMICGLSIIFCLFEENVSYRYLLMIIALGALVLSGSRVSFLIVIGVVTFGLLKRLIIGKVEKKQIANKLLIVILIIAIIVCTLVLAKYSKLNITFLQSNIIERMKEALYINSLESDGSVLGRMQSIAIGLKIINDHPFGISGYFVNLQLETQRYGFPTFPHSTVVSYYILLGPIVLIFLIYIVKLIKQLYKRSLSLFLCLLYICIFVCLTGGPIVNYKVFYFYFFFVSISHDKLIFFTKYCS